MSLFNLFKKKTSSRENIVDQQNVPTIEKTTGTCFEDEFSDIQTGLISLFKEVAEGKVDKVYGYCSIENKGYMFNAFFQKGERILTLNEIENDTETVWELLKLGTDDLIKLEAVCQKYDKPTPTEIRLYYDAVSGKFHANIKYEPVCEDQSSGEVFSQWLDEMREKCG